MRRACGIGLVMMLAVLAAACGSSSKSTPAQGSATSTTTAGQSGRSAPAVLRLAKVPKIKLRILVDARGHAVYLYLPNHKDKTSKVPAAVLKVWPRVTTKEQQPLVGKGLAQAKLDVVTTAAGRQLRYNGHLLYTFTGDTKAGTANGQGLGKVWFVVSQAGDPIP